MWLEVLAVIEAAPLHTPETLAVVHERLAETEAAVHGDALVYARANRALHAAMNAPASEQLKSMMSDLFDRGWQARRGSSVYTLVPDTREQAQAGHVAIVRALDAGDADDAAAAAMAHRDATLRVWRTALAERRTRPGAES